MIKCKLNSMLGSKHQMFTFCNTGLPPPPPNAACHVFFAYHYLEHHNVIYLFTSGVAGRRLYSHATTERYNTIITLYNVNFVCILFTNIIYCLIDNNG